MLASAGDTVLGTHRLSSSAPCGRTTQTSATTAGHGYAGTRCRSNSPVHAHPCTARPSAVARESPITSGNAAARARQQRGITTAGTGSHGMTPIGTATSEEDACRSAFALVIHVRDEEVAGSNPVTPTNRPPGQNPSARFLTRPFDRRAAAWGESGEKILKSAPRPGGRPTSGLPKPHSWPRALLASLRHRVATWPQHAADLVVDLRRAHIASRQARSLRRRAVLIDDA